MIGRVRCVFAVCILVAACGSSATTVDITLTFDGTVDDATLAGVKTFLFQASGDESAAFPTTISRAAMRMERVVYRPAPDTHSLSIEVDAIDTSGRVVASGSGGPVTIRTGQSVALSVSLSTSQPQGDVDLGATDAAVVADLALTTPMSPSFVNSSFKTSTSTSSVSSIDVNLPTNSKSGDLLLAMIGGVNITDTTPVLFDTPAGWSQLTTVNNQSPIPATAAWFWKYATASEPVSYTFARSSGPGPTLGCIVAYEGTVEPDANGPFDSPMTQANGAATRAYFPTVVTQHGYELLVFNGFAPDDFDAESWSSPSGVSVRQSAVIISADVPFVGVSDGQLRYSDFLHASSRSFSLSVGLRSGSP
jgi:hypothetical protein